MFLFDPAARFRRSIRSSRDGADLAGPVETHRSFLSWAEHCVECAAPDCYATCAMFEAAPTGKCRRFDNGIVPVRKPDGGLAGEVSFRRWGKLEALGNAALLPVTSIFRLESLLSAARWLLVGLGAPIAAISGNRRWLRLEEALHRRLVTRLRRGVKPDFLPNYFIAEIENPASQPISLLLTIAIDQRNLGRITRARDLPAPFVADLVAPPGLSRHSIDAAQAATIMASGLPFVLGLTPQGDEEVKLVFHRLDLARAVAAQDAGHVGEALAQSGQSSLPKALPSAKLVIFDLDNTIWDGVLLEGEVRLRPGVAELFAKLDERGVLLSVASKNSRADAFERLEAMGLAEYLLHSQIGWLPKSQGVADVVSALNIGMDTVIFVDDNPFERAEVERAHPMVEVLADTALASLAEHPRLQGDVTPESRMRRRMYQESAAREGAAAKFGDNYIEFLRTCAIEVTIRGDLPEDSDRIVELVQRTNQLNFSGRKYGASEIKAILAQVDRPRHVIECRDRFGSYGTVGFCLSRVDDSLDDLTGATLVVEDFMLSCRVQGKFIEQALLWELVRRAPKPVARVHIEFQKTERNRAAQLVLESLGFSPKPSGGYECGVEEQGFELDFLTIVSGNTASPPRS